ncbi:MAG: dihydrodipicolinate synthase family protein [Desulfatiglandaceae bacterium]
MNTADKALPPRGLVADLVTPFTEDGALDTEGLERLIRRVSPHVHGMLAAGPSAGEGHTLDCETRVEIMVRALRAAEGKAPIFIWITAGNIQETFTFLETLEHAATTPRHLLYWIDTPLYYHSNRGLAELYNEISRRTQRPLLLHNDPGFISRSNNPLKRGNIRTAILKELAQIDSIAGLVFSGSMDRARNYQKACRRRQGFRIYDHNESNFLDFPSMSGVVSIGANLAPRPWHAITETSLQRTRGNTDYPDFLHQIWEMGRHIRALMEAYSKAPVPIVKNALHKMGVIASPRTAAPYDDDMSEPAERIVAEIEESESY